ncbi:hypothetical protein [Streptomyces sp. NPDC056468]|uniref:nSTAND1 domain-containing NTPase n=1 Tax=unclassified Streptomyces TaxID=2593676 RepID=UPI0036ACD451
MQGKPFVGLRPFTADESKVFFGRSEEISILSNLIQVSSLLIVYAPSGTGKSSLLNAGLLPAVEKSGDFSVLYIADHGTDVVQAVRDLCDGAPTGTDGTLPERQSLVEIAEWHHERTESRLLVIIDQFEERLKQPGSMDDLWRELGIVGNSRSDALTVLISLREDYLGSLEPLMQRVPSLLDSRYRIPPLSLAALKEAVYGPLGRFGLRGGVSDELVEAVLEDLTESDSSSVRVEPGYFQVVWKRLWELHEEGIAAFDSIDAYESEDRASGIVKLFVDSRIETLLSPFEIMVLAASVRYLVLPTGAKVPLAVDDLAGLMRRDDFDDADAVAWEILTGYNLMHSVVRSLFSKLSRTETPLLRRAIRGERVEFQLVHDLLGGVLLDWNRRYSTELAAGAVTPAIGVGDTKRSHVHFMVSHILELRARLAVPLNGAEITAPRMEQRARQYDDIREYLFLIRGVSHNLPRRTKVLIRPLVKLRLPMEKEIDGAVFALKDTVYSGTNSEVSDAEQIQVALEDLIISSWRAGRFLQDEFSGVYVPEEVDIWEMCRGTGLFVFYLAPVVLGLWLSRLIAGEIYTLPDVSYAPIPFTVFAILMAGLYLVVWKEDYDYNGHSPKSIRFWIWWPRKLLSVLVCGRFGVFSWPIHLFLPVLTSYLVASVVEAAGSSPSAGFHCAAIVTFISSAIGYSVMKDL